MLGELGLEGLEGDARGEVGSVQVVAAVGGAELLLLLLLLLLLRESPSEGGGVVEESPAFGERWKKI